MRRALRSAREALGANAELIVADGGSTDGTAAEVEGMARVVRSRPGRGRQMNEGARQARGEVLVFLHADTRLTPEAGRALRDLIAAEPDVVGGCFALRLEGPSARRPIARALGAAITARSRWLRTATGDQAIFARRSCFEQLSGYPEIDLFEDVLFYRKLRRAGRIEVLETPVATSDRRWRGAGYARTIATHLGLRFLMLVGVPPARLARYYESLAGVGQRGQRGQRGPPVST